MEQSLDTPKSLVEFRKRDEQVQVFEGFKETEPNIHRGFKEPTCFDEQKVGFRIIAPRYICHSHQLYENKNLRKTPDRIRRLCGKDFCRLSVAILEKLI